MRRWILPTILAAMAALLTGGCLSHSETAATAAKTSSSVTLPGAVSPARRMDEGQGPGQGGDKYDRIFENSFLGAVDNPLSTFSIDVDTASYSRARMYLLQNRQLPPPDAVRIEEFVNYFRYSYAPPSDEHPVATNVEVADCPWAPGHRLMRIGIQGRLPETERPNANLVFLIDVSGSMGVPNRLPLLKRSLKRLVDRLTDHDSVSMVVYAGAAGLVLPTTQGSDKAAILAALERLEAGGSTNGGHGIQLAYQQALRHFISGGTNRVILCTDGDFNVGMTSTGELVRFAEEQAKQNVFLTVLGFGMGNHNDALLKQLASKANGNFAFIDGDAEARKVLVEQLQATLVTIAKDVKIQVEFNPALVHSYRLIGYENRVLAAQDFQDDKKDASEIGAGHQVTALYEIVPAGSPSTPEVAAVDALRYQRKSDLSKESTSGELLTVKLRYKMPEEDSSRLLSFSVMDAGLGFAQSSRDFQFAAAVASFGMLLRNSEHRGEASYPAVLEMARSSSTNDAGGYQAEFLQMVQAAMELQ